MFKFLLSIGPNSSLLGQTNAQSERSSSSSSRQPSASASSISSTANALNKKRGTEKTVFIFDASKVSYETLAKTFFEIHDPTQTNGQGPDIGSQYLSAVFVNNKEEREITNRLIKILESKGLKVATKVLNKTDFYTAEEYHQDHYERKGGTPYCHTRVKRFD